LGKFIVISAPQPLRPPRQNDQFHPPPEADAGAACMRKMMMIAYGVLKHQKPFDPAHHGQPQLNPSS